MNKKREQYKKFQEFMVEARKKANLTQVELAKILGKPQSYVSKYELGERRLDVLEFLEISKILKITLKQIEKLFKISF